MPVRPSFTRKTVYRMISGLSLGTLVVEASPSSGSLITARLAAEQGREVFALSGSIHHPGARGCHQLIREGAQLVEGVEHILEALQGWRSLAPLATTVAVEESIPCCASWLPDRSTAKNWRGSASCRCRRCWSS